MGIADQAAQRFDGMDASYNAQTRYLEHRQQCIDGQRELDERLAAAAAKEEN
jgi:hypothetical protein